MTKSTKSPKRAKGKHVPFATIRVEYAKAKGIDVAVASKRLRAKLRGAYGKNDVVTKYIDRKGANADGNRYPDATPAEATALLSL